jgi:hypothetical protein
MRIVGLGRLEGFRVGAVGPLLITVFRETATLEGLTLLEDVQGRFVKEHPKMFALNVVFGAAVKAPSAEVRERAAALQARFDGSTAASATVLAVKGLAATIARGFLAALALMSSASKSTQVFKSAPDALDWLRGLPGFPPELSALSAAELEAFVTDVR